MRFAAKNSFFLGNNAFANKVHSDLHHSCSGTFTVTGLQEPEFAFLYGELHVLHIAVVVLKLLLNTVEFFIQFWHSLFHRRILACTLSLADTLQFSPTTATFKCDLLRGTDTGYNVLTLCINKIFTIEQILTCGGVTAEANTCCGCLTHISEYHCHNAYGCSPFVWNSFHLTIEDSALVHPAAEYSADSAPQLLNRIGWKIATGLLFNSCFEACNKQFELIYVQILV